MSFRSGVNFSHPLFHSSACNFAPTAELIYIFSLHSIYRIEWVSEKKVHDCLWTRRNKMWAKFYAKSRKLAVKWWIISRCFYVVQWTTQRFYHERFKFIHSFIHPSHSLEKCALWAADKRRKKNKLWVVNIWNLNTQQAFSILHIYELPQVTPRCASGQWIFVPKTNFDY